MRFHSWPLTGTSCDSYQWICELPTELLASRSLLVFSSIISYAVGSGSLLARSRSESDHYPPWSHALDRRGSYVHIEIPLEFAIEKTLNTSMPSILQHSPEHHRSTNVSLPKNLNAYHSSTGARELIDNLERRH